LASPVLACGFTLGFLIPLEGSQHADVSGQGGGEPTLLIIPGGITDVVCLVSSAHELSTQLTALVPDQERCASEWLCGWRSRCTTL